MCVCVWGGGGGRENEREREREDEGGWEALMEGGCRRLCMREERKEGGREGGEKGRREERREGGRETECRASLDCLSLVYKHRQVSLLRRQPPTPNTHNKGPHHMIVWG